MTIGTLQMNPIQLFSAIIENNPIAAATILTEAGVSHDGTVQGMKNAVKKLLTVNDNRVLKLMDVPFIDKGAGDEFSVIVKAKQGTKVKKGTVESIGNILGFVGDLLAPKEPPKDNTVLWVALGSITLLMAFAFAVYYFNKPKTSASA